MTDVNELLEIYESIGISAKQAERFKAMASISEAAIESHRAACRERGDEFTSEALLRLAAPTSRTRPTKPGGRRTAADIRRIKDAICSVLVEDHPMTVRQIYYRLVSLGEIDKTEGEYKQTVCRLLGVMRREREIPFGWIADSTRWMRKPESYSSLQAMLRRQKRIYRRSLWADQDAYVEVWLEKDALAGVLYDVTEEWDVPLMVTRGYPSLSYVYEAAETIANQDKPTFLYYFGDHDPSGVDITRAVEDGIREFAPDAELYFKRVAVTVDQIERWDLPTRPTKKTDSRSKGFEGESVEVDAIAPSDLREIVRGCIEQHIDADLLQRTQLAEDAERDTLSAWIEAMPGGEAAAQ